jgi:hypothetical protein
VNLKEGYRVDGAIKGLKNMKIDVRFATEVSRETGNVNAPSWESIGINIDPVDVNLNYIDIDVDPMDINVDPIDIDIDSMSIDLPVKVDTGCKIQGATNNTKASGLIDIDQVEAMCGSDISLQIHRTERIAQIQVHRYNNQKSKSF